ncbi:MAG: TROVE domain-containing protein [Anaerolineae bacterium]|nr:TROVE domain-containing protein [Anaerolineae bacterium]
MKQYTRVFDLTQRQQIDLRQMRNEAGGYTFQVGDMERARRFLLIGSERTYYAGSTHLTLESAQAIQRILATDPGEPVAWQLVEMIGEIAKSGRAPKRSPWLFALAMAISERHSPTKDIRQNARFVAVECISTARQLFEFVAYATQLRGKGPALRRVIRDWYNGKPVDELTYQAIKYVSGSGWTHRDLLRVGHPKPVDLQHGRLYKALIHGLGEERAGDDWEARLEAALVMNGTHDIQQAVELIQRWNFTWEMVPTWLLNERLVWEALLEKIPTGALLRSLGRISSTGLFQDSREWTRQVADRLSTAEAVKGARLHPMNILPAMLTYKAGHSTYGRQEWPVSQAIVDALDAAFYLAFQNVAPVGKPMLVGVDVSGSMHGSMVHGIEGVSSVMGAAALALMLAHVEPDIEFMAFDDRAHDLPISKRQRLDDAVQTVANLVHGGTDCSLPVAWAQQARDPFDGIVILTDNQTWYGDKHPYVAFRDYQAKKNPAARLATVQMCNNSHTIVTPEDPTSMDFVGFDTALHPALAQFMQGEL